jgi:catechol 2,3-dioxygenase-like lactoylglutathione lyase family enzyme
MSYRYAGIDHVQLAGPRGCEEEARSFFGGLLGMEEIPKPENLRKRGGVWFRCGVHELHIGVQDDFVPASKAHPAFEVHGIGELRSRLEEAGISANEDEPIAGKTRFHIRDPFGNRIEFVENNV